MIVYPDITNNKKGNIMSTKERMLKALRANRNRIAFTTRQARRRFGVSGISQRINDLRNDGYKIVTITKNVNGRVVAGYRLVA
jgi:hypothetical protein